MLVVGDASNVICNTPVAGYGVRERCEGPVELLWAGANVIAKRLA